MKLLISILFIAALCGCKTAPKPAPKVDAVPPLPSNESVLHPRFKAAVVLPEKQYKLAWDQPNMYGVVGWEVWKANVVGSINYFSLWQTVSTNEVSLMPLDPQAFFIVRAVDTNGAVSDWNK